MGIPRVNSLRQHREQNLRRNSNGSVGRPTIVRDAPKRVDFVTPNAAPTPPTAASPLLKTTPPWLRKNPPPPITNSTPEIPVSTMAKPDLKGYATEVESITPVVNREPSKVLTVGSTSHKDEGIAMKIKAMDKKSQVIRFGQGATLSPFAETDTYRLNPPPQWGGGPS